MIIRKLDDSANQEANEKLGIKQNLLE